MTFGISSPIEQRTRRTPSLRPEDLEDVLAQVTKKDLTVVVAPPGEGKSTATREAIRRRIERARAQGQTYRVLWAVHGTLGEGSLGHEARREFGELARILRGQGHFNTQDEYEAQFVWDGQAPVVILSHAHLRTLLGTLQEDPKAYLDARRAFAARADLLVIDEDPLFALVRSTAPNRLRCAQSQECDEDEGEVRPLRLSDLSEMRNGKKSNVARALQTLMEDVVAGAFPESAILAVDNPITQDAWRSLTGAPFWAAFREALGEGTPDWNTFEGLLKERERYLPPVVVRTLQEDYERALSGKPYSQRFGLVWNDKKGGPRQVVFRYDVLQPLHPVVPTIVLDAYASEALYKAAFPEHRVRLVTLGQHVPLEVEYSEELRYDRQNLLNDSTWWRREYLMEQVDDLNAGERGTGKTLVLSYQVVVKQLQKNHPPEEARGYAYWFAGRGVNTWHGRHVFALHPPERPRLFEHHVLSALAPTNAAKRRKFAETLRVTELLQMLHRGRQTTFAPDDPARPRVLLAFNPELPKEDRTRIQLRPFTPRRWVTKGSKNPFWNYAVVKVAEELLELYGGVPLVTLMALDLYAPTPGWAALAKEVRGQLRRDVKRSPHNVPLLAAWAEDTRSLQRSLGPFEAVTSHKPRQVLEALNRARQPLGLKKFEVHVPRDWVRPGVIETILFAKTERDAKAALLKLLNVHKPPHLESQTELK